MNSKFLTAMTAAGIIALGMSGVRAEANPPTADKSAVAPAGNIGDNNQDKRDKPPAMRGEGKKRMEPIEGREADPRIVELIVKGKYAQEFAEVVKLRKEAPAKAQELMQSLRKKVVDEQKAEREKIREMVVEYKKNQDPQQLETIKAKITEKLNERLEMEGKIILQSEATIKEMQEKLDKFKAEHQKRVENKDKMIENKIKDISKSPEMHY